jgi:hypothetical protein
MMTNYEENKSDPCRSADTIPAQTEPNGYQQALEDFGITELLEKLSRFQANDFDAQSLHPEPEELESVAALLIQQLTNSLNSKLLGSYLNAHRHGNSDVFSSPISLEFPQSVSLPSDFPDSALPPHFLYGDRVRLVPVGGDREWGVVIGRFYNYAAAGCGVTSCGSTKPARVHLG